jgi:hypothetical protein
MDFPDFYAAVPRLRVHDPLAEVLGSARDGVLEYGYADVVRLCGHSCPTVASAYWLTWLALAALWPGGLPERGGVKVELREDARSGSCGVVATVVQMLTGAAGNSGFKGLGGRHARAGLLRWAPDLPLAMRFTRLDNGAAVDASADLTLLPQDSELPALLERCARGRADAAMLARLGELWQRRVRHLLVDLARDPGVFIVRPLPRQQDRTAMLVRGRFPGSRSSDRPADAA